MKGSSPSKSNLANVLLSMISSRFEWHVVARPLPTNRLCLFSMITNVQSPSLILDTRSCCAQGLWTFHSFCNVFLVFLIFHWVPINWPCTWQTQISLLQLAIFEVTHFQSPKSLQKRVRLCMTHQLMIEFAK